MEEVKMATFRFEGYKILKSNFERKENPEGKEITMGFNPKGKIHKSESTFELFIDFNAVDENSSFELQLSIVGNFSFENITFENDKIDPIFIVNAPAILFPYIRAYISTLTSLSGGITPIILPTVNLTNMKDTLLNNIEFVE